MAVESKWNIFSGLGKTEAIIMYVCDVRGLKLKDMTAPPQVVFESYFKMI